MAHLDRFAPVESVLTYLYVRSGTFAVQITLSEPFSNLFNASIMAHLEQFYVVVGSVMYFFVHSLADTTRNYSI